MDDKFDSSADLNDGSSLYGAICGGKGLRRRGSPRNLIRENSSITFTKSGGGLG